MTERAPSHFHQQRPHQPIAVSGDAAGALRLSGVELFGYHADIRTDLASRAKTMWIIEHGHYRFRQSWTNTADRPQQLHAVIGGPKFIQLGHYFRKLLLHRSELGQLHPQLAAP